MISSLRWKNRQRVSKKLLGLALKVNPYQSIMYGLYIRPGKPIEPRWDILYISGCYMDGTEAPAGDAISFTNTTPVYVR